MPRKTKFSKHEIIEAGLFQIRDGGWESLTPKTVSKRLNSSTMPIFSHFPNMHALREAILDHAWELLETYTSRNYTGDVWVDQSIGYIIFARDNDRLFGCMHYGKPDDIRERRRKFWISISKPLENHPAFEDMTSEQIGWTRHIRSLLTHGIAISVGTGLATVWSNDEVIKQVLCLCSDILVEGFKNRKNQLKALSELIPPETLKVIRTVRKE